MGQEDVNEAANRISLNLLDLGLSPEQIEWLTDMIAEESATMIQRMMQRADAAGYTPEQLMGVMNNVMGTVAKDVDDYLIEIPEGE